MHVVFIPTNYPTEQQPVKGIFYRQQALTIAENGISVTVVFIQLISIINLIRNFSLYKKSSLSNQANKNITEIKKRKILWFPGSKRLFLFFHAYFTRKELKKLSNIDLIHAHTGWYAGHTALKTAKKLRIPFVLTEHSSLIFKQEELNTFQKKIIEKTYKGAKKLISVSHSLRKSMQNFTTKTIDVIPNLVDDTFFSLPKDAKKKHTIISIGTLIETKGFHVLIEAFAKISDNIPDYQLVIIGNGKTGYEQRLKQQINALGQEDKIILVGSLPRNEIRDMLQTSRIFALPSYYETFGVVYIEAMACGLPVLASDSGAPAEFINTSNGLLCPPNDVSSTADKLLKMIGNLHLYNAVEIRKETVIKYGKKAIAQQISDIYKQIT